MKRTSEYGRGYATCLLQFVWHEPRLTNAEDWESMMTVFTMIRAEAGAEARFVTVWASGASDHLYDLVTGGRVPWRSRAAARALQTVALECGHGFTDEPWTREQAIGWVTTARELLREVGDPQTLEEAMEIDRRLGLRPLTGDSATCSRPIPPFSELNG